MTKDQEYTHARAIGAEIFGSANNEAEFWRLRAEIADLEAQNADLLDALKQAEPILDAASATAREDGGTMIPGARPAWDAVRAAIERITP